MSIEAHPGRASASRRFARTWGELTPDGQTAHVLRFVFPDRTVTVLTGDIHRWEHLQGEPEQLILSAGRELFTVDGLYLTEIRLALELRRLTELRPNHAGPSRPGPRIRSITIESA